MEIPTLDFSSTVDTSRPFSSVKEAVAIFGERLLVGEIYSPKPFSDTTPKPEASWSPMKPKEDNGNVLLDSLKKLEAELKETKVELKLLKERENETEVALATLNAELHKNMSKLAEAEAGKAEAEAGKAAGATKTVRFERELIINKDGGIIREEEEEEENNKRAQTLTQIMSLGEKDHINYFGGKIEKKMTKKKKPIIPLVGDLFFKKKGSSTNHHNPLYASPCFYD